jgi:NADH:ubiquinone reductase (H+-translocating)
VEQLIYEHQRPGRMLASTLKLNQQPLIRGVSMNARPQVVIIGGGFGGLSAAQTLKRAPVDVTLIDRRNFHLFQPLLYQVATGSLSPGEISAPLRGVLSKQKNTRVLLGDVIDVNPDTNSILLADGAIVQYDFLIVSAGAQSSYYGHEEWRKWAPSLKSIEEATEIRHKILYAFEVAERISDPVARASWLTFVIVGAGATGVELAGAIGEIARQTLRNDFRSIHPEEAQIILMDGAPRVLMPFPEDLSRRATKALERLGVKVRTGVMVKAIDREGVTIAQGPTEIRLDARTVIWAGGVAAPPVGRALAESAGAETDKSGRIKVKPDLTLPRFRNIFVIGDLAICLDRSGKPLPGVAQVAMQGGAYAAKSIVKRIKTGEASPPFKYFDKGSLAVIGRAAAVANAFGVKLSGLPAWLMWAFIHLMYIVEFRNRVLVFVQWAFEDLTFNRGARLITGSSTTDFDFNKEIAAQSADATTDRRHPIGTTP